MFDRAPIAVLVTGGEEHRLLYTNDAFQSMFGDRPIGAPVWEALRDLVGQDTLAALDEALATGETPRLDDVYVTADRGGGPHERLFRMSLSGIPLQGGESGLLAMVQEVTAQTAATRRMRAMEKELRRLRRRYQSIVWAGVHGVWVTGPHGESRESQGWQRLTGQTPEESLGRGWMRALHPEDRVHAEEWWDKAAEQAVSLYEVTHRVRTRDGVYRHIRFRCVPVRENGAVVEWVGTSTDVEQEWQEERRRRLLERAAAAATDITNLEEMCQALAGVIVPELADSCHVYLLPEASGGLPHAPIVTERVASAVREGLPRLPTRRKEYQTVDSALVRAVRRRRPVELSYPPGRPSFSCPEAVRTWMAEIGSHSLALLPIVVEGEVAAVVTTGACGDRPPIPCDDVRLMREMLDHAHDAVSKALRFRRTQRVALALQHSLLAEPPHVPGLELAARYQASPTAAEIGGDWYDAFMLSCGAVKLVIGDVAGHDLAAAVCMSQVRNMLRALAVDRDESPGDVLRRLTRALETLNGESTATCVLTRLERDDEGVWRMTYSVAGHPPPLLVTGEGEGRFLQDAGNPLLGISHDQPWISAAQPLPPHSTLLLYTDGLVERRGEDLGEGLERLRRCAEPLAREPLGRFCDELLTGMPVTGEDDIAMIALRVPPEGRYEGVAS
ncbi:SpoIIE family protein phosphatase [Microbispora catharanthi]|uniref:protein-serine/threonine phosphatase n=1 Tax=Microbispora catharanthi TaxID=1712871 RepID=A0A5N6BMH7_9ACTN|nr:SpoIIE family protein phosphatase [Microbispora catharanthi]KAB8181273.1 SpoIIE family protein phosphatase [Microbispora catharanthi]